MWQTVKPYRIRFDPGGDIPRNNLKIEREEVHIHNMRSLLPRLSLDTNGFEVHPLHTAMEYHDFDDPQRIERTYMPELRAAVMGKRGAKQVHTLDYEVSVPTLHAQVEWLTILLAT